MTEPEPETEPASPPAPSVEPDVADSPPKPEESVGRPLGPIALACVCYLLFCTLLPLIPLPLRTTPRHILAIGALLSTLVYMALLLWVPWTISGARPRTRVAVLLGLGMLALYPGLTFVAPWLFAFRPGHPPPTLVLMLWNPVTGLWMAAGFCLVGVALSHVVREAKLLLPLGLVLGLIDIVGAMTPVGFTANAVASHPEVVRALSVPVPTVGHLQPLTYVGPGDALFMGFFLSVVHRFRMNKGATFRLMYVLLALSLVIVLFTGISIAALFPMGLSVILANLRFFRFSREETFAMIYAGAITLLAAVGFFFYTNHHVFHH